jgi:ribonuclease HI
VGFYEKGISTVTCRGKNGVVSGFFERVSQVKQRIRVVGVVRDGERVLVLKRSMGRAEIVPHFELPRGKIFFGEQPEEALSRVLHEAAQVVTEKIELVDAITFTDLSGASQLGNLFIVYNARISGDVKRVYGKYTAYKWVKVDEIGSFNLDDATLAVFESMKGGVELEPSFRATASSATVYVDGGSRGNPGPAGVGYYILAPDKVVLKRGGEFIGFDTSRMAEYYALKEGVEQAIELGLTEARFVSDSMMVVGQMNGVLKVKNRDLKLVYNDIKRLLKGLKAYSFIHVNREDNVEADAEANRAIDEYVRKGGRGSR